MASKTRIPQISPAGTVATLFAFIAGAKGFVVDLAGLIALLSGAITLPAGSFLESSPVALGVASYFSMVYSILLIVYFGRSLVYRRWQQVGWLPNELVAKRSTLVICALLWLPAFLLWSVLMWRIGAAAGFPPIAAFMFIVFWFMNVAGGAALINDITGDLHLYFDPSATVPARQTK